MTPSRRYRKAYKLGRRDGYELGYAQGLIDGNPINNVLKGMAQLAKSLADAARDNPNLLKALNADEEPEEVE